MIIQEINVNYAIPNKLKGEVESLYARLNPANNKRHLRSESNLSAG